jgi:N-carbamoylputrescine amidase
MRKIALAVTQMASRGDWKQNCDKAEALVRAAAAKGAQVILLQELFDGDYFCIEQHAALLGRASDSAGHPTVARFSALARELGVVLPVSFFERAGNVHFNTVAIADADGRVLGNYRKSHIPDGPGYREKFYFSPGDTGARVWTTAFGRIGVGICWDQWFPELARLMALKGAEILLYPTAIGSEPEAPGYDSSAHWQNTMRGHAAANIMPLCASNRVGTEAARDGTSLTFYGRSFIADQQGEIVAEMDRTEESARVHAFDLDAIGELRRSWGIFRDRRPDLYGQLLTLDAGPATGM